MSSRDKRINYYFFLHIPSGTTSAPKLYSTSLSLSEEEDEDANAVVVTCLVFAAASDDEGFGKSDDGDSLNPL